MDVLKPEVYWIGNRCYRINPCPNSQSQYVSYSDDSKNDECQAAVTSHKPYVETDEYADTPPVNVDEETTEYDAENVDVVKEDNGFKVVCNIPSSLFPQIIGGKGAVKKRIEGETRTRIYVPRQNEKGDIIVRGPSEGDVKRGYKRVMQIARNARFKREATHFACFPMNEASVVQKAKEFKEKVMAECGKTSRGLDLDVFQEPEKLHITICVMVLLDERERRTAAEILSSMENEIREQMKGKERLQVHLKGLEIMNDDPSQVDVLYAKCEPINGSNTYILQNVADAIAKKFADEGLGKEFRGENVKLHCTVINTRYRNGGGDSETKNEAGVENRKQDDNYRKRNTQYSPRESFDARAVLQKFGEFDFGIVEISEVKIATRYTRANDGFYKCYTAISF